MRIAVVEGQTLTSGIKTIVASIPFGLLRGRLVTPWRDSRANEGYQRKPSDSRVAKLMMEIRKGRVDIPTAILLNARDSTWTNAFSAKNLPDASTFDLNRYEGSFAVVDGQHRVLAFEHLYNEDPEKYGNYKLQLVMMLGASERQELEQFYIVNSTAKSVKTDLAYDLLKQRADTDGRVMQGLIESGQDWKIEAQHLAEVFAEKSEIWRRRIRLANEPKGVTTIPSASFVTSLRKFLTYPFIKNLSFENKFDLMEAYWKGVRSVMPTPFANSDDFTLMKGIGVWAMHEILPEVIEVLRSRNLSLFKPECYAEILKPVLKNLEAQNARNEDVAGEDFWLTAPKGGAAGSFSSSAGKRVLISKLLRNMPEPKVV